MVAVLISIVGRAGTTAATWNARDYTTYSRSLGPAIPAGATVFSVDFAPYYVARDRGWKLMVFGVGKPQAKLAKSVDFVITHSPDRGEIPAWLDPAAFTLANAFDQTMTFWGKREGYRSAVWKRLAAP
jgi:hypothetical protein